MGDSNEKRVYLLSLGSTVCFPGECTRVSIPNGLFYDYVQRYCDTQLPSLLTVLPELEPLLALVQYGTQEPLIVHARVDSRAEHSETVKECIELGGPPECAQHVVSEFFETDRLLADFEARKDAVTSKS